MSSGALDSDSLKASFLERKTPLHVSRLGIRVWKARQGAVTVPTVTVRRRGPVTACAGPGSNLHLSLSGSLARTGSRFRRPGSANGPLFQWSFSEPSSRGSPTQSARNQFQHCSAYRVYHLQCTAKCEDLQYICTLDFKTHFKLVVFLGIRTGTSCGPGPAVTASGWAQDGPRMDAAMFQSLLLSMQKFSPLLSNPQLLWSIGLPRTRTPSGQRPRPGPPGRDSAASALVIAHR